MLAARSARMVLNGVVDRDMMDLVVGSRNGDFVERIFAVIEEGEDVCVRRKGLVVSMRRSLILSVM